MESEDEVRALLKSVAAQASSLRPMPDLKTLQQGADHVRRSNRRAFPYARKRSGANMTDLKTADDRTVAPAPTARRRPARWAMAAVVAAATAGIATAVVTTSPEPASAAVLAAVDQTSAVNSLRIAMSVGTFDGTSKVSINADVNGTDYRAVTRDELTGDSESITVVGNTSYLTAGGKTEREEVPAGEQLPSFAKAASSIIRAATGAANTERVGTATVRGIETEHYRLTVNLSGSGKNPLAAIPAEQLELFGADFIQPSQYPAVIDVWVADNLVRRFDMTAAKANGGSSTEFYDFGAPITITAPTQS